MVKSEEHLHFRKQLRYFLTESIIIFGKTDFQLRFLATLLHWFFLLQNHVMLTIGGIFHIWTVIIAYRESGFFSALTTALLPVISEIYWLYHLFTTDSEQFNLYLVLFIVCPFFVFLLYNNEKHSVSPRLF